MRFWKKKEKKISCAGSGLNASVIAKIDAYNMVFNGGASMMFKEEKNERDKV